MVLDSVTNIRLSTHPHQHLYFGGQLHLSDCKCLNCHVQILHSLYKDSDADSYATFIKFFKCLVWAFGIMTLNFVNSKQTGMFSTAGLELNSSTGFSHSEALVIHIYQIKKMLGALNKNVSVFFWLHWDLSSEKLAT